MTTPPKTICYGTITAISEQADQPLQCWLLDPPPDDFEINAAKIKLVNRLRYIRDLVYLVSPRSTFSSALAVRVRDLESLSDPWELDRVPLVQGNGEPFKAFEFRDTSVRHPFFATKTYASELRTGGVIQRSKRRNKFLFLGFTEKLLDIAVHQDFREITSYSIEPRTTGTLVECALPSQTYRNWDLPASVQESASQTGGYYRFMLPSQVFVAGSGLAFGWLSFPEKIEAD